MLDLRLVVDSEPFSDKVLRRGFPLCIGPSFERWWMTWTSFSSPTPGPQLKLVVIQWLKKCAKTTQNTTPRPTFGRNYFCRSGGSRVKSLGDVGKQKFQRLIDVDLCSYFIYTSYTYCIYVHYIRLIHVCMFVNLVAVEHLRLTMP